MDKNNIFSLIVIILTITSFVLVSSERVARGNDSEIATHITTHTYNECLRIQKELFHDKAEAKSKIRDWF